MIPDITHQQFLVLEILSKNGEIPGKTLRAEMENEGVDSSLPAFYQFMERLESEAYVIGRYSVKVINKQRVKSRMYRLSASGRVARLKTIHFYSRHMKV